MFLVKHVALCCRTLRHIFFYDIENTKEYIGIKNVRIFSGLTEMRTIQLLKTSLDFYRYISLVGHVSVNSHIPE